MFEQHINLLARLRLHQSQRDQSIPTLSVLMGKTIEARHAWIEWLQDIDRRTAIFAFTAQSSLFTTWLAVVTEQHDLRSLVLHKIAPLVDQSAEQLSTWLATTSNYQRRLFWEQFAPVSDETFILRSLLDALPTALDSNGQADELTFETNDEDISILLRQFATAAQLLPSTSVPGLFVLPPEESTHMRLRQIITVVTALAEAVPTLPVALALTTEQGLFILDKSPESRTKAMVRSGLIPIVSPGPDTIRQWLYRHNVNDATHLQPILDLAQKHGMTTEIMATALTLLDPIAPSAIAEPGPPFRSHAEWLLFQYLEAKETTVGRFQVNAQLAIDFGGRPMEVDFLDTKAKIVIELDGHYHFANLDNYRRDRHKDRLLQQNGFLVLRFLSEDVVSQLEIIFAALDQALAARQP